MPSSGAYSGIGSVIVEEGGELIMDVAALPITTGQNVNLVAPGMFFNYDPFLYNNILGLSLTGPDEITFAAGTYELAVSGNFNRTQSGGNHVGVIFTAELSGVPSTQFIASLLCNDDATGGTLYYRGWIFQLVLAVATTFRIHAQRGVNAGGSITTTDQGLTIYFKRLA